MIPAIKSGDYDLILQDRGVLSGRIYAETCGNSTYHVENLEDYILEVVQSELDLEYLYDHILIFHNDNGLSLAQNAKNEFTTGDAMESRGDEFHATIYEKFRSCDWIYYSTTWTASHHDVAGKTTEQLVAECVKTLALNN